MKKLTYTLLFLLVANFGIAQNTWTLSGYVSNMQSVMFDSIGSNWVNDNLIHNRLEFRFYTPKYWTMGVDVRNRIITGETLKYTPNYADGVQSDRGLIDMSWNVVDEQSVLFNTNIDRAFVMFEKGKLNVTVGRQRINWGKTFVWNPNDIFNSYSFFDFDYMEKPGSDAVNVEYYTGMASSLNVVAKIDSAKNITAGAKYGFNLFNYDFQVIAGYINEQEWVAGAGLTGSIWKLTLRSEASYLQPDKNFADTTGLFVASVGTEYMFQNSAMISVEFLYNQMPKQPQVGGSFLQVYDAPLSVKNLSFTEYNIFAQATYPFSPIISGTLAGMYYPEIKGFFVGPTLSISLTQNLDFSVIAQTFSGEFQNPLTGKDQRLLFNLAFLKMKYSF